GPTRRRRKPSASWRRRCCGVWASWPRSGRCPRSGDRGRKQRDPVASVILPIFPLPDVTFFPHTLLPLHVFEARYRAMIMDTLARIRDACGRLLRALERPPDLLDTALAAGQPPGAIADRIAAAVVPDPRLRQELLETLDVGRRLDRLALALDELINELRGGRE